MEGIKNISEIPAGRGKFKEVYDELNKLVIGSKVELDYDKLGFDNAVKAYNCISYANSRGRISGKVRKKGNVIYFERL